MQYQHQWYVERKRAYYGPYGSQREAIDTATLAARTEAGTGIETRVIVQEGPYQFRVEWVSERVPTRADVDLAEVTESPALPSFYRFNRLKDLLNYFRRWPYDRK